MRPEWAGARDQGTRPLRNLCVEFPSPCNVNSIRRSLTGSWEWGRQGFPTR